MIETLNVIMANWFKNVNDANKYFSRIVTLTEVIRAFYKIVSKYGLSGNEF